MAATSAANIAEALVIIPAGSQPSADRRDLRNE
jgi:hypothetical protein